MNSLLSFIVLLGLLIFVHELGHFLFAKLFGVKVLKFSLGFGPKIFGRQRGETEYLISAFPLGGYVKMLGEQPEDEVAAEDKARSFSAKPVWQRMIVVAAGPLFNLFFAVLLFWTIFAVAGLPDLVPGTTIGDVSPDSPAAAAGLQAGDTIVAIDGTPTLKWEDVSAMVAACEGRQLALTIDRGGKTLELVGQPTTQPTRNIFGEVVGERYLLGISRLDHLVYRKIGLGEAFVAGCSQTWTFIYLTIMGIVKIIQSVVPASELGGPIRIAQLAGERLQAGMLHWLHFMGLLSINLGVLNLLPIPILDGGHLVFYSLEAVRRKPLSLSAQEIWQRFGLILLGTLMIFVFYNDIARLFGMGG
ncbi:MAG: RIP metalloprotease RseP [Desulfobulbaceae bacterium]|nr:RIP metalloprotease RseP [Desulfobulbaceae bacterium]